MNLFYIVCIIVFPLFLYWLWFRDNKSKFNLLFKLLSVWLYFLFIYYAGQWAFLSFHLRNFFLILLIIATIKALMKFKNLILFDKKSKWGWFQFGAQFLFTILLLWCCIQLVNAFSTDENGIGIAFPLREGIIVHGGNSTLINYHHSDSTSQQYSLDITKLNSWGTTANGFFRGDLNIYSIYGDTIFGPCDAKVVSIQDGLENAPIGVLQKQNPAGNHVILEYDNNLILLAHMMKNSIFVSAGDMVSKGQPIGRVGNSGRSTGPHLHIHAIAGTDTNKIVSGGNGIPIYFEGEFPVRNDRIRK